MKYHVSTRKIHPKSCHDMSQPNFICLADVKCAAWKYIGSCRWTMRAYLSEKKETRKSNTKGHGNNNFCIDTWRTFQFSSLSSSLFWESKKSFSLAPKIVLNFAYLKLRSFSDNQLLKFVFLGKSDNKTDSAVYLETCTQRKSSVLLGRSSQWGEFHWKSDLK